MPVFPVLGCMSLLTLQGTLMATCGPCTLSTDRKWTPSRGRSVSTSPLSRKSFYFSFMSKYRKDYLENIFLKEFVKRCSGSLGVPLIYNWFLLVSSSPGGSCQTCQESTSSVEPPLPGCGLWQWEVREANPVSALSKLRSHQETALKVWPYKSFLHVSADVVHQRDRRKLSVTKLVCA